MLRRVIVVAWIFILASAKLQGQSYKLQSHGFSNGSERLNSPSYELTAVIGQNTVGNISSDSYRLFAGFLVSAVPRTPELKLTSVNITPLTVEPGDPFNLTFTVNNTGGVAVKGDIEVGVFLSTNDVFDPQDTELDQFVAASDLAAGGSAPFPEAGQGVKEIIIPANTTLGPYFVFVVVDPGNLIDEVNEANNEFSQELMVSETTVDPLSISQPIHVSGVDSITISVIVSDGTGARTVTFHQRGILGDNFPDPESVPSPPDTVVVTIANTELDELGLEYFFSASDASTQTPLTTERHFIYREQSANDESIPGLSSGGMRENYRLISIPYILEDNLVQSIFGTLGEYDDSKWRLIHYQNGKNVDFPAFNRITHGHGYWFNSVDPVQIMLAAVSVPQYNQQTPFALNLSQGWNQIGAPFPYDIKWSDVVAANPNAPISTLKVFQPSTISFTESDDLRAWSGGFVFADNSAQINFPVTLKSGAGGRIAKGIKEAGLHNNQWLVSLTLTHGIGVNDMVGFGMHPDASEGKDRYDDITLPRFFNYLEMKTEHSDYFAPFFTRDVVPTVDQHRWEFVVHSNFEGERALIQWNPSGFGDNDCMLQLFDVSARQFVDMKGASFYEFQLHGSKQFQIIYAYDEDAWQSHLTLMGSPFPNPAVKTINIPVIVKDQEAIGLEIIDLMGRKVKNLFTGILSSGSHTFSWNLDDESHNRVSPGVYLVNFVSGKNHQLKKILIK